MAARSIEQTFGDVIRHFRAQNGVSQEVLADAAKLHRTYISLLERGLRIPSLTVILQLSHALGIRPQELIAEFDGRYSKAAGGKRG